jgi:DNA segregation ATPase FtsK/SpoIIIE, S-DNA-T family
MTDSRSRPPLSAFETGPTTDDKGRFLSPAVSAWLQRRLYQVLGLVCLVLALCLATALLTYSSRDPSFSTAARAVADSAIENRLGLPGAYLSDLLWQTLGYAAFIPGFAFIGWGWRLIALRSLSRWSYLRLPLALFCTLLATVPLALLVSGRAGGALGLLLAAPLQSGFAAIIPTSLAPLLIAALGGAVALCCFLVSIGAQPSIIVTEALKRAMGGARRAGQHLAAARAAQLDTHALSPGTRMATLDGEGPPAPSFAGASRQTKPSPTGRPTYAESPLAANTIAPPQPSAHPHAIVEKRPFSILPDVARKMEKARQASLHLDDDPSAEQQELPPVDILQLPPQGHGKTLDQATLQDNASFLEGVLKDFGVLGQIVKISPGPVVTLYELEPAPGTKSSRVIGLADDIARSMSAISVRVAVVPGRNVIGIEMPNAVRETVYLRELLMADAYEKTQQRLPLVLGKDIGGHPVIADLARMPHLLVAGTTGSGKSVAINTMILSILYRLPPDRCRFIMVDPKMLELSIYEGIPHLLAPVVTDPKKAIVALKWAVREMEDRYRNMSKLGVRNIDGYNGRLREAREQSEVLTRRVQTGFDPDTGKPIFEEQPIDLKELPYIIVIVDEMADLMLVAGKDIEAAIQRLAQMARAAGIHLIMATQRPSVDVITGTIKANFPTRISFQVTSKIDSRTILGEQGAEQLLGQGDMLYMAGGGRITRVHGPFVRDEEVEQVVRFLKAQGEPAYVDAVTDDSDDEESTSDEGSLGGGNGGGDDALYDQAVAIVAREGKASTSFIQRHLRIGYNSAARLIERMEKEGVVSKANHAGKRDVLARHSDD